MHSKALKTPTGKAFKGSVSLLGSNGRLQLRFSFGGKRHYISTGLADTSHNRKVPELRAAEIEKDILYERFDSTLERYKPKTALSTVTPVTPIQKPKLQLDELWEKYSEFKKPQVSPSTYVKDFAKHRNHISKLPTRSLSEASAIRDYLLAYLSLDAARRCLTQLKACGNWAVDEGLIDSNPFGSMRIKSPKGLAENCDVNPFSKAERDLIIATFASDHFYSHYTNYVRFLFFTGRRPSEAIALKWKYVTSSSIQFRESVVVSEDGLVLKKGLKTQRKRDFPLTPEVQTILDDVRREAVSSEALIFASPKGKFVSLSISTTFLVAHGSQS